MEPVIGKSSYRLLLIGVVVLFYGALAVLWLEGSAAAYTRVMALWGVRAVNLPGGWYTRNPVPFLDLGSVLSWHECRAGSNMIADKLCSQSHAANYPPLWLYTPLEWIGLRHALLAGLALGSLFLGSLVFILRPRDGPEFCIAAAACLSHVPVFAIERGNVDMILFLLMLATMALWRRHHPVLSFAAMMAGGFLKFYPFALLLLLTRERLRRLAGFFAAAILIAACYMVLAWRYIVHIDGMLPEAFYFYDMFGAMLLPLGVTDGLGLPLFAFRLLLAPALLAGLWAALRLAEHYADLLAAIDWTEQRLSLMLAGSLIILFCFILGASVDYRAIFLLPVLPGLLALRERVPNRCFSRLMSLGVAATLFCLYSEMLRANLVAGLTLLLGHAPESLLEKLPLVVCFLLREAVWWFEVVLLAGLVLSFVRRSASFRDADALLARWDGHA